jgi:hypothetical protein
MGLGGVFAGRQKWWVLGGLAMLAAFAAFGARVAFMTSYPGAINALHVDLAP